MSVVATRWVIELGSAACPTGYFLHVFEDGEGHLWSRDLGRALRFASKHEAERFGSNHLDCDFAARGRPAHDLVGDAHRVPEDEVDDDLAAS